MIEIVFGEDRKAAGEEVLRVLGEGYESFEGENLGLGDLEGVFLGTTLFSKGSGEGRRVLIKDLSENKEIWGEFAEKIEGFFRTDAKVVVFETKFDKRTAAAKKLIKAGVEIKEFKAKQKGDPRAVFGVFDLAMRDGKKAVEELEKIENENDPYMFFGLMVTQALKRLEWKPNGAKEIRVLKELAELDLEMKSTAVEPWMLIKGFLIKLSSI